MDISEAIEAIRKLKNKTKDPYEGYGTLAPKAEEKETKEGMPKQDVTHVVKVERYGDALIVPDEIDLKVAIKHLIDLDKSMEAEYSMNRTFPVFPWDGANAFARVVENIFGFLVQKPTPGFWADTPPQTIYIDTPKGSIPVLWGRATIPAIDGYIETGVMVENGRMLFHLNATVKKKHEKRVKHLFDEVGKYLLANSIYAGNAIRLKLFDDDGDALEAVEVKPDFIDLTKVDPSKVVFADHLAQQVQDYILTRIEYPEACNAMDVPGKSGALLHGIPGTGKTLTMMVAAKVATAKGVTVIYCNSTQEFSGAVEFAKMYLPAMVICEDIDRATEGGRDKSVDRILNIMDGILTKHQDLKFIFTSNAVDQVQQAMLRPGRIDVAIEVLPPDDKTVQKLIIQTAGGFLVENPDLAEVGRLLSGQIPAVIEEVVKRAKLSAIARTKGNVGQIKLNGTDLANAALSIKSQMALLNRKVPKIDTEIESAARIVSNGLGSLAEAIKFNLEAPKVKVVAKGAAGFLGDIQSEIGGHPKE